MLVSESHLVIRIFSEGCRNTLPIAKRNDADKTQEQGVEFGDLANWIDNHSYLATSADLIEEYGEQEDKLPDGAQTLQDLFEPLQGEEFASAEDARRAIFNMVDDRAEGCEELFWR